MRELDLVQEWSGQLSKSDPVVVFCVYGFHVGCRTAIMMREACSDAKYMKGGHSAWKAMGGAIKPIAEEPPEIKASGTPPHPAMKGRLHEHAQRVLSAA